MTDFDALSLTELRSRQSAKWRVYPPDVLPAWVAEMDVPLAEPVTAALAQAIARGDTGYAFAGELGAAFAAFAGAWFGWDVDPRRVSLIPDVLVGISEILRALTAPDARIVVNSPVYPPFYRVIGEVARRVENVPLQRGRTGWELDLAGLERAFAGGAAAYVLCSPHNPLGIVFDPATLRAVAELALRHGVLVIADEIHAPLTLAGATFTPFLPIAEAAGLDAVGLSSASKAWNLPGLKTAVMIAGSPGMRERLGAVPAELPYRASNLGVLASVAAFRDGLPWLRDLLVHIDRNRRLLGELLARELPAVAYEPPQASYLAWLDCSGLQLAGDPATVFLERGRVALTRGRDFGAEGAACVRLNMGTSGAILSEIVARMRRAL